MNWTFERQEIEDVASRAEGTLQVWVVNLVGEAIETQEGLSTGTLR
jgi:subtilisin-like proprotein convertase family protein